MDMMVFVQRALFWIFLIGIGIYLVRLFFSPYTPPVIKKEDKKIVDAEVVSYEKRNA